MVNKFRNKQFPQPSYTGESRRQECLPKTHIKVWIPGHFERFEVFFSFAVYKSLFLNLNDPRNTYLMQSIISVGWKRIIAVHDSRAEAKFRSKRQLDRKNVGTKKNVCLRVAKNILNKRIVCLWTCILYSSNAREPHLSGAFSRGKPRPLLSVRKKFVEQYSYKENEICLSNWKFNVRIVETHSHFYWEYFML